MRARLRDEAAAFLLAAQFLTRLPLPADVGYTSARMAASPRYYPAVGLVLGALTAAVLWAASLGFPPVLAALVATAAGLMLTGCFHEDGFADACDGLGGGATAARALEIMRDSRLGTYGTAGLAMMLAAKVLALAAMPVPVAAAALVAGHAASRASAVAVIATGRYVRDHGTGKPVSVGVSRGGFGLAAATGGAAMLALVPGAGWGAAAGGLAGLALGHALMRARFERRLGGYTGDCLGAVQQTSEIGLYLGVVACL